jgi:peptidoglycan/LPS O-acetylase OafA/YrhL
MNLVRSSGFLGPGGFRLILASVVVVHHSFAFRAGPWAVYVFFILSGYWITQMWHNRYVQTRNSYFTFLVSRWWRIAPVFFVCMVLGFWSGVLTHDSAVLSLSTDPVWWLRQIPIAASTGPIKALPPSWSLDIDMQFYLLAPMAIYLVSKLSAKVRWPLVAILLLLPSILLWQGIDIAAPPYLAVFSGFIVAGIILALSNWVARSSTIVTGVVIFLVGSALLVALPETRTAIWYEGKWDVDVSPITSVWWVLGAILILPFVSRNVRVKSSRVDRFLGDLVYPLYLFHWIPREWYYYACENSHSVFVRILALLANFGLAFAGAILILILIDLPLGRLRTKWVNSRQLKMEAQTSRASVSVSRVVGKDVAR